MRRYHFQGWPGAFGGRKGIPRYLSTDRQRLTDVLVSVACYLQTDDPAPDPPIPVPRSTLRAWHWVLWRATQDEPPPD